MSKNRTDLDLLTQLPPKLLFLESKVQAGGITFHSPLLLPPHWINPHTPGLQPETTDPFPPHPRSCCLGSRTHVAFLAHHRSLLTGLLTPAWRPSVHLALPTEQCHCAPSNPHPQLLNTPAGPSKGTSCLRSLRLHPNTTILPPDATTLGLCTFCPHCLEHPANFCSSFSQKPSDSCLIKLTSASSV